MTRSYQEQHAVKKAALARRKEGCAKNRDRDLNISTIKVQLGRCVIHRVLCGGRLMFLHNLHLAGFNYQAVEVSSYV